MTLTRAQIREQPCPKCGVGPKEQCRLTGKGALKRIRQGMGHFERMQAAQAESRAWVEPDLDLIEDDFPGED